MLKLVWNLMNPTFEVMEVSVGAVTGWSLMVTDADKHSIMIFGDKEMFQLISQIVGLCATHTQFRKALLEGIADA